MDIRKKQLLAWVSRIDELEFEGHLFKVPKGYKEYLTYFYETL